MEKLLVANNVSKTFGKYKAINNISIEVPKGSIFGLLGPNGAGKTTFIRVINQITMPDTGNVILDGEQLQPHHIQQIGYLPLVHPGLPAPHVIIAISRGDPSGHLPQEV